jgi:hypothetical protein
VIIAPSCKIVTLGATLEDEPVDPACDLDRHCRRQDEVLVTKLALHRERESYRLISKTRGAVKIPRSIGWGLENLRREGNPCPSD